MSNSTTKNRYIDTSFWDDEWITELDPSEKLLYIYLLTNPLTNVSGIYKLTKRRICFDTGFNDTTVNYIFQKFESAKKVFRYGEYVILKSWCKHQTWETNDKIKTGIVNCLKDVPSDVLVCAYKNGYTFDLIPILKMKGYDIDSLSSPKNDDTKGMDSLSMGIDNSLSESNYLNSNSNLNSNENLNTHTNLNSDEEENFENQENSCVPESVCASESSLPSDFETQGISDQHKYYARLVFDVWEKADLPRPKTGFITFLMRDFRLALGELRNQKLHSDDVIKACENYASVVELGRQGKSWWKSKSTFENFVKPNIIKRFLPDYFSIDDFKDSGKKNGSAISRSAEYDNVEIDF